MDRVSEMRENRSSAAALKTSLSNLRSKILDQPIVVLEGRDDVPVFQTWITRASESFSWEPFVSKGKKNSMALRKLLERDKTGLSNKVSFIIDHDYDGLDNESPGDDLYVLPGYSIENFIGTAQALDFFLKSSLNLHSKPDQRLLAKNFFEKCLADYCDYLVKPCAILWTARKSKVKFIEARDAVIDKFDFDENGVRPGEGSSLNDLIQYDGEIENGQIEEGQKHLTKLPLPLWIRGKYIYSFFDKCCRVLHEDLNKEHPIIFGLSLRVKLEVGSTSMARLAGAVDLPKGLKDAVRKWEIG